MEDGDDGTGLNTEDVDDGTGLNTEDGDDGTGLNTEDGDDGTGLNAEDGDDGTGLNAEDVGVSMDCIYRVELLDRSVIKWSVNGQPCGLSVTGAHNLLVTLYG